MNMKSEVETYSWDVDVYAKLRKSYLKGEYIGVGSDNIGKISNLEKKFTEENDPYIEVTYEYKDR